MFAFEFAIAGGQIAWLVFVIGISILAGFIYYAAPQVPVSTKSEAIGVAVVVLLVGLIWVGFVMDQRGTALAVERDLHKQGFVVDSVNSYSETAVIKTPDYSLIEYQYKYDDARDRNYLVKKSAHVIVNGPAITRAQLTRSELKPKEPR